jgi:hypothetical protein
MQRSPQSDVLGLLRRLLSLTFVMFRISLNIANVAAATLLLLPLLLLLLLLLLRPLLISYVQRVSIMISNARLAAWLAGRLAG